MLPKIGLQLLDVQAVQGPMPHGLAATAHYKQTILPQPSHNQTGGSKVKFGKGARG